MRFMALLRKELRESLPWILLGCILLLGVGALIIRVYTVSGMYTWQYQNMKPGEAVDSYHLVSYSILNNINIWLICISVGLGLVLALRQFGLAFLTRTWPFMIHRSASKTIIIVSKLAAAGIVLYVCLGVIWTILYKYASQPRTFISPPPFRAFIDGWLFITLGAVTYLGTTLSVLSTSRWYTTRIFGLVVAGIVVGLASIESSRPEACILILVSIVMLLSQIFYTFLTREF